MSKNNVVKNEIIEEDLDFSAFMEDSPYDDEAEANDVMDRMVDVSYHEMKTAVALTKIAVEKQSAKEMDIEAVFSTYKQALEVVAQSSPLKAILEKFFVEQ